MLNVKRVVLLIVIWVKCLCLTYPTFIRRQSQTGFFYCKGGSSKKIAYNYKNCLRPTIGLHDDSANDNSAIDKMAARFLTILMIQRLFFLKKKAKHFFLPLMGFTYRLFPTPHGCQKLLKLPSRGFSTPGRS